MTLTPEAKRINDLLYLMVKLDEVIINEIREVNRGKGHSAERIEESLEYWIKDRIIYMKRDETK